MSYLLGIDLGTTFTSAAICRRVADGWGPAEVVALSTEHASVGSVVYADPSGSLLFGDAAAQQVVSGPGSVVREFKRRVGDDTPLSVGDTVWAAHELMAELACWVVETVSTREGAPPMAVAVTHPASWGEHRKALLTAALDEVGLCDAELLPEPHAAAINHASAGRLDVGDTVAVYDLGGGMFDAAVLRQRDPDVFEQLGTPTGHDRLGGLDFDAMVFDHVCRAHPDVVADLDPADDGQVSAVALLRGECTAAKEALSEDTEAVIPVLLPQVQGQVRLSQAEFEDMVRPALEDSVALLRAAIDSTGMLPADLRSVLLVGGSAPIPLVTELLSSALGRPVVTASAPEASVALGAVLALRSEAPTLVVASPARPAGDDVPTSLAPVTPRRRLRGRTLVVAGALAVAGVAVGTVTGLPGHLTSGGAPAQAATRADDHSPATGAQDSGAQDSTATTAPGTGASRTGTVLPGSAASTSASGHDAASTATKQRTTTWPGTTTRPGAPVRTTANRPTSAVAGPTPSTSASSAPTQQSSTVGPPPTQDTTTAPPTTQPEQTSTDTAPVDEPPGSATDAEPPPAAD
jgi:molecular chaperone DnaK